MQPIASGRNKTAVTNELTGFPGKAKTKVLFIIPNVVGFPGFMLRRPKMTLPFSSRYGFIKSYSPILTPPVVTIISH